jgi:glycosyltransferase involved in cell wall biosynthesis
MSSPIHVALIGPYPPAGERHGGHSGVASYTANLAHALVERDVDVTVVAPTLAGDPDRFFDGEVQVRRAFPLGAGALPRAARAAVAIAPDVVHLQWETFLYGGARSLAGLLPGLATLHRAPAPLVTTAHQVVDPAEIDRTYTRLHRVGMPAAAARLGIATVQTAIDRASAATIVHEASFTRVLRSAVVIPHGIEEQPRIDRAEARRRLGFDDRFTALCFGFLAPYKGLETALEAASVADRSIGLVIAGGEHPRLVGGSTFGDELRARYGDAARFTGRVPDADVDALFAAADVALFPYPRPFSSSGALALALAHDTPVLLSPALARCAGAPSMLVAEMEPRALADQLERLNQKPAALDELARWSSILASGRRWPAVAERHTDLYREVLDVPRSPRRRLRASQPGRRSPVPRLLPSARRSRRHRGQRRSRRDRA